MTNDTQDRVKSAILALTDNNILHMCGGINPSQSQKDLLWQIMNEHINTILDSLELSISAPSQEREKALKDMPSPKMQSCLAPEWYVKHYKTIKAALQSPRPRDELTAADYEEVMADHRRLVRELDVALNGEDGAAKQASLCDIVSQVIAEGIKARPRADVPGYVLVPVEPTEEMWSGLARDIVMARDMRCLTTDRMREHLTNLGHTTLPPEIGKELHADKHMAKGDICVLVYKAMLSAAPKPEVKK